MTEQIAGVIYFLAWAILSPAGFSVCLLNLRDARADYEWSMKQFGPGSPEVEVSRNYIRRDAVRLGSCFAFVLALIAAATIGSLTGLFLVLANGLVLANSIGDRKQRKRELRGGHANGNLS